MRYNNEERLGVYSVAKIFSENLKWIFREQPINDFGIDAFVEITKDRIDSIPTGKLFGVQIKSGESYFKESKDDHFVFRGSKKHLEYWLNHSMPVIVVIYDKINNIAYWQEINHATAILTEKSFKIKIAKKNILINSSRMMLESIVLFKNKFQYKLWQLLTSREQTNQLLKKKQLSLYIEIDSIPYSNEYHITLLVCDEDWGIYPGVFYGLDNEQANIFEYSFRLLNGGSLTEAVNDTLPWADLFVDGANATDGLLTSLLADEILSYDQEEFVEEVSELRARNAFLEMACYLSGSSIQKLELKANELTSAFFQMDAFLNKEPIVKTLVYL
ncbi:DUF4365 domain-containing protein [Pedobacter steynii]|uniref:DUF4365 domain-containing protein n=1 Tax=Pedobacter steynii TaxID=430522 RepID=A0A1D7QP95_9SPHI|nr:DUF4365 domain-containing protein [Pedobacter steynii]AOM80479.1 hypothetical protein BFS30_26965 [Pedobacter steynii]